MAKVAIPQSSVTLRKQAEYNLISEKACTFLKDQRHTHPSYGRDISILADERRWLYEKLRSENTYTDSEKLRIDANKQVLYLDPAELEAEYQRLLDEDRKRVQYETQQLYPMICGA